ncbi:MAG: hypothetical protein ABL904_06035 [Hyphomicrobiaceae bacterium]
MSAIVHAGDAAEGGAEIVISPERVFESRSDLDAFETRVGDKIRNSDPDNRVTTSAV